jgi:hypothetical protein
MPQPTDPSRDLLFGLLALQTGLIDQGALFAAFAAWTRDKARSLADHLVEQGHLDWFWTVDFSKYPTCRNLRNHKTGVAPCAPSSTTTRGATCWTVGGRATPAAWNTVPHVPLTSFLNKNRFPSCCTSVVCNWPRS